MNPEDEKVIKDILSKPFVAIVTSAITFSLTSLLWAYVSDFGCGC